MWLVPNSAWLNGVGVEAKGSKCNLKNLECIDHTKRGLPRRSSSMKLLECPLTLLFLESSNLCSHEGLIGPLWELSKEIFIRMKPSLFVFTDQVNSCAEETCQVAL